MKTVIPSQVCKFLQNPDIRMAEECIVKGKLVEQFHV
jgi:hypothetical protein